MPNTSGSKAEFSTVVLGGRARKPYTAPRLEIHGKVAKLTQTGSRGGSDASGNAGMMA